MILAFHSIFSMYGFWLPNDPRGSGSDYIAAWELLRYGPATKTNSKRSVAHVPHDHALRMQAKAALTYPAVQITGLQAVTIAAGFVKAVVEGPYKVYACAILPDHVHLVIGAHPRRRGPFEESRNEKAQAGRTMARRRSPTLGRAWMEHCSGVRRSRVACDSLCGTESAQGREEAAEMELCDSV